MKSNYDVIVVGSGAGGAMSAYMLTHAGYRVLMLEAGRDYDPASETPMFQMERDAPLRGAATPDRPKGYYMATHNGGWEIEGQPYTHADGEQFNWFRTRMLGGRTNHWARWSPRYGPYDFKPKSRDGLGVDWPFAYEDIADWYDKTERLIGVYGRNDGLENHPDSAPDAIQPAPAPRAYELFMKAACDELGIPCVPVNRAVLTRPLDDRAACFYATHCMRGCSIGAAFQTTTSLLPMAKKTGKLNIKTGAMVREVLTDSSGRPNGVEFIDQATNTHHQVHARVVVLAASACETARLMLNSTSENHPDGLANTSGQVGRNLLDNPQSKPVVAYFPALDGRPNYDEFGAASAHLHIPWWLYQEQARGELDFQRGYQLIFFGGRQPPGMGLGGVADLADGYGRDLKQQVRSQFGSTMTFIAQGEMIPSDDCYCEIDPNVKDRWGIPVLKYHWKWSDQEQRQARHMRQTILTLVERLQGQIVTLPEEDDFLSPGGTCIHEVGTARMGDDPTLSVTNQYGQCWDADNLFLMDGSVFASEAHKNPTLTILMLAMRNSEYLAQQLSKGEL
ncbi:GMC family oxidoreductase [Pseudomaricurvus alkylphenolicus]|uniref:GMC family oxidoreductase n=1 Tax=Pseudomaricurvus alkylphenolicus TaxID=1306991 RepID=UPI00141FE0B8|nr:GMC family oxidoreductase [Pseudomaricurvus alkylphenolicus]NIB38218.1 GMC family oxidoreductase [Pseudomaricurvus alkylphenolicus]